MSIRWFTKEGRGMQLSQTGRCYWTELEVDSCVLKVAHQKSRAHFGRLLNRGWVFLVALIRMLPDPKLRLQCVNGLVGFQVQQMHPSQRRFTRVKDFAIKHKYVLVNKLRTGHGSTNNSQGCFR